MRLILFACLALLSAIPASAQSTPKSIALTEKSNVPIKDLSTSLEKECPNVSITNDTAKSDYTLEAIKRPIREGLRIIPENGFDLTLFNRVGQTVRSTSVTSLGSGMKDICRAIKTSLAVEVVDTRNLTESIDARGPTGRRTHTDTSTIYVIVDGEHALLDCYERRTGCATIGPGKYFGEQEGDGIWVNYQMPLTHKWVRNHYKVAGSW